MANDLKKLTDEELDREIMALSSGGKSTKDLSDEELEAEINSLMPKPKQPTKRSEPDFIRGAFEAAPAALAGLGGGIGATAAGVPTLGLGAPGGAVVGAGLGGMVGSGIRSLGRRFVYDQPESVGEMYGSAFAKEPIIGAASEAGGQAAGKAIKMAAETPAGQAVIKGIEKGASKVGGLAARVGEMITGVPKKEIETFAKNSKKVLEMAKSSDNNTMEAADEIRRGFDETIKAKRAEINSSLSSALNNSNKFVRIGDVVDVLEGQKARINPDLYPEQISQIDGLIKKMRSVGDNGVLTMQEANQVKSYLQDQASSAYQRPGEIFSIGTEAAKAAKSGAAKLREIINAAEPSVKEMNNALSRLHDIEDAMNINLLKVGGPEAALMSAGSGQNLRNAKALKELGAITGEDFLGQAENLAAMRTFGSPKFMPADTTGKSAARMGLASGIGALIGGAPGAVVGAGMTSPAATKYAIEAAKLGGGALSEAAANPMLRNLISREVMQSTPSVIDRRLKKLKEGK